MVCGVRWIGFEKRYHDTSNRTIIIPDVDGYSEKSSTRTIRSIWSVAAANSSRALTLSSLAPSEQCYSKPLMGNMGPLYKYPHQTPMSLSHESL